MTDFTRNYAPVNLEGTTDETVEIVLKFKDDYVGAWEINADNTLKFEQVKRLLSSKHHICFLQKQKIDEKNNRSRHKVIVHIENKKAIELSVVLWSDKIDAFTTLHSYYVSRGKEVSFFNEPVKDTLKNTCSFRIATLNEKTGTNSNAFIQLYKNIDVQNIPTVDINKEKDKEIWKTYVVALKKLVKQKVQVWKIQKIDKPVVDNLNDNSERTNLLDIY
jgi:hypothetical protein